MIFGKMKNEWFLVAFFGGKKTLNFVKWNNHKDNEIFLDYWDYIRSPHHADTELEIISGTFLLLTSEEEI